MNDEVYTLEILYYDDGNIGLKIWDNNMDEILYEENITDKTSSKKRNQTSLPI